MDYSDLNDFDFNLPESLIASEPKKERSNSKLLYHNFSHSHSEHLNFSMLPNTLSEGDVLILNNSKVLPARMNLSKRTGGKIEVLFIEEINTTEFVGIFGSSRPPKVDTIISKKNYEFRVKSIEENKITLTNLNKRGIIEILNDCGEIPLPKYIKRPVNLNDKESYQTVYAEKYGSIAAPTAGLHFTKNLLDELRKKGVKIEFITLHVSYNTFKPIKENDYTQHDIGFEKFDIDKSVFDTIHISKKNKRRIVAVGTTVTRVLEYCFSENIDQTISSKTNLFIYPGYKFKIINGLITNFHLPKSSLLLLTSAFLGKDRSLSLYKDAIDKRYRFYSYGDSMFIDKIDEV